MKINSRILFEAEFLNQTRVRKLRAAVASIVVICICLGFFLNQATAGNNKPAVPLVKAVPSITLLESNSKKAAPPTLSVEQLPPNTKTHTIKLRAGDTLKKVFTQQGVSAKDLQTVLTADKKTKYFTKLPTGKTLKLHVQPNKTLHSLNLDIPGGCVVLVSRQNQNFKITKKELPVEKQLAFGKGKIKDSTLTLASKSTGLDSKVMLQMSEIFSSNIKLAANDSFRVLFEEKYVNGEKIETGHILAAELVKGGRKYQAVRYTDNAGQTGYYSVEGNSLQQTFLRIPVNFERISSPFGPRKKPNKRGASRQHKGVDFSAPHGTEIQVTANGDISFLGKQKGYGNVVRVQHGARYSTVYAHLSRFAKNLKAGSKVKQGQIIGYVGSTGSSTGNHLHYEFLVGGIHCDPLSVTFPRKSQIAGENKKHFQAHAKEMLRLLESYDRIKLASNSFPINE